MVGARISRYLDALRLDPSWDFGRATCGNKDPTETQRLTLHQKKTKLAGLN